MISWSHCQLCCIFYLKYIRSCFRMGFLLESVLGLVLKCHCSIYKVCLRAPLFTLARCTKSNSGRCSLAQNSPYFELRVSFPMERQIFAKMTAPHSRDGKELTEVSYSSLVLTKAAPSSAYWKKSNCVYVTSRKGVFFSVALISLLH